MVLRTKRLHIPESFHLLVKGEIICRYVDVVNIIVLSLWLISNTIEKREAKAGPDGYWVVRSSTSDFQWDECIRNISANYHGDLLSTDIRTWDILQVAPASLVSDNRLVSQRYLQVLARPDLVQLQAVWLVIDEQGFITC